MTDNFSKNPRQRIFSAESPPAICERYSRLSEVERQIKDVLSLSEEEVLQRLSVNNRESRDFLKEETLVCLLTLAHAENLFEIENLIAERLFLICEKRIRKNLRNKSFDQNFIEETVGDLRLLMLTQIFNRAHESYDFWESRFYKALKSLIYVYLRKHSSSRQATSLFSELSNEDDGTDFENSLKSERDFSKELEIRETSKTILEKMPEDLRKIFILTYLDEETQKTIAERFGISDRTVRNKLDKINEFLDRWRDSDGEVK